MKTEIEDATSTSKNKKDNAKFYWIKLKTDFFTGDEMDFLLSQENGAEYVVLYQMLCLSTANNDGRLETKIGEMIIPYNAKKIARDCKYFDIDTVNIAMALYKQLGLIYEESQNGILKIANFADMVGAESKWAAKKRLYRERKKQLGCSQDSMNDDEEDSVTEEDSYTENFNEEIPHDDVPEKGQSEGHFNGLREDIVRQEYRDKSIEYRYIDNRYIDNNNSVSVSVSDEALFDFFKRFEISKEEDKKAIIKHLQNGMTLEVIQNGLLIPFNRNAMNYDSETETVPISNPVEYGLTILENWNNMGVKTLTDVKKYNKLNKDQTEMLGSKEINHNKNFGKGNL